MHPSIIWIDNGLTIRWIDTTPKDIWFVIDESKSSLGPAAHGYRIIRIYQPGRPLYARGRYLTSWNGRNYPIYSDDPPLPQSFRQTLSRREYERIANDQRYWQKRTQQALENVKVKFQTQSRWPHFYLLPPKQQ